MNKSKPLRKKAPLVNRHTAAAKVNTTELTPEWKELEADLKEAKTALDVYKVVVRMLRTPKYRIFKATRFSSTTGKPIDGQWQVQPVEDRKIEFLPYRGNLMSVNLNKKAVKELEADIKYFQDKGIRVMTSGTKLVEEPVYAMTVSVSSICTGGGHNDIATYSTGLVFRKIDTIQAIL